MKKTVLNMLFAFVYLFATTLIPSTAVALSAEQKKLLQSGVYYFNVQKNNQCPTTNNSAGAATGNTYIVGDSISTGLHSINLEEQLSKVTGGATNINHDSGRSITKPGTEIKTSGLQAVENDKEQIKGAKNIIVVLGTNPENPFEQNLKTMMGNLKALNPGAQYYWVDIGATRSDLATTWSGYNQIIYNNAATQGYTVISRYKALFGQDKDPLNIDSSLKIPGSADNVHGGYQQLADEMVRVFQQGSRGEKAVDTNLGVREKIAQLLFVRVNSEQEANDAVKKYKVGGIYISEWKDQNVLKTLSTSNPLKLFIGIDEEGGQVHRLSDRGSMPSAREMGSLPNNQVNAIGAQWGAIMQEYSINVDFAPVVDLYNANSPIIGQKDRAFSENPDVVSEKAGAFADGLRSKQITPVFKHFPGHGNSTNDSHTGTATTPTLSQLKGADLLPYKKLLTNTNSMVMMGHLSVPDLSSAEQPTSINKAAYDLLRNEYGFPGVAITDDLGDMKAIKDLYTLPQASEKAITAGADIALFNGVGSLKEIIDNLESKYKNNDSLKKRIDESYGRVVKLKGANSSTGGTCACVALNGADNKAKIWNYLVAKNLSPQQIAGIMGNMQSESAGTWDPRIVEYGYPNSRGEISVAGQPSSLDDNIPPDAPGKNGQPGYGIIQWSGGRKRNLQVFSDSKGIPPNSLGLQLDFLWEELNKGYKTSVLDPILASNSLEEVTYIFLAKFEVPANIPGTRPARENNARAILAEFGSGAVTGGGSPSC